MSIENLLSDPESDMEEETVSLLETLLPKREIMAGMSQRLVPAAWGLGCTLHPGLGSTSAS